MARNDPMTRSEFLRGGLRSVLEFAARVLDDQVEASAGKMVVPLLRPPGAIDELSFLATCTRCDLCIEACPHNALVRATAIAGAAVDTPTLVPDKAPCYLCPETPCILACADGALQPVEKIKLGTAHVIQSKCFAWNSQADRCDYCYDRCPLKGRAIVMENNKPRVCEEACTGCGICEFFCPAPGNAISVLPARP